MTRYGNTNPASLVARIVLKSVQKVESNIFVEKMKQRNGNSKATRAARPVRPNYVPIERVGSPGYIYRLRRQAASALACL